MKPDQALSPFALDKARRGSQISPVLVVGPFPPPVHGFAEITRALAAYLETGPGGCRVNTASALKSALPRHLAQILRNLRAGWLVLRAPARGYRVLSLGCNAGWGLLYTLFLAGLARMAGLRVALHHHSYAYINRRSRLMAMLCRMGGPGLSHVFLARSMQDSFRTLYGAGLPSVILPNALFVPPNPDKPAVPGVAGRPVTLGLLSNLDADKGLHEFITTARLLRQSGSAAEVRMVLAGPIRHESDKARVEAAVAEGVLTWLGPLYGADKTRFFGGLDLFLFPTRYLHEAQPTVIYEALASGVPVIAFDRGAIRDQVRDCLAVVPAECDFALAVQDILTGLRALGPDGWEQLRARARARHAEDIDQGARAVAALFGALDTASALPDKAEGAT